MTDVCPLQKFVTPCLNFVTFCTCINVWSSTCNDCTNFSVYLLIHSCFLLHYTSYDVVSQIY